MAKAAAGAAAAGPAGVRLATRMRRADGSTAEVEGTATAVTYRGRPAVQVLLREVVDDRPAAAGDVYRDALTGLTSPLLLPDRLSVAISQAYRHRARVGVVHVDVDGFSALDERHRPAPGRPRAARRGPPPLALRAPGRHRRPARGRRLRPRPAGPAPRRGRDPHRREGAARAAQALPPDRRRRPPHRERGDRGLPGGRRGRAGAPRLGRAVLAPRPRGGRRPARVERPRSRRGRLRRPGARGGPAGRPRRRQPWRSTARRRPRASCTTSRSSPSAPDASWASRRSCAGSTRRWASSSPRASSPGRTSRGSSSPSGPGSSAPRPCRSASGSEASARCGWPSTSRRPSS